MLREHYPLDKYFEEILEYIPDLSPDLGKINGYLEDEKLYRLIKKDLAQRRPKTTQTGRNSTPVEVILRMLVVKRLYGYSMKYARPNGAKTIWLIKITVTTCALPWKPLCARSNIHFPLASCRCADSSE